MFSIQNLDIQRLDRVLFMVEDFTIRPGDLVVIKGGNGVGKTTFLQTLCNSVQEKGLCVSHEGGRDYFFLPQPFSLMEGETVEKNLYFYQKYFHRHKNFLSLLTQEDPFHIVSFQRRYVRHLSNGEKRRVSLSRLMGEMKTPLWLLDEPEQGLDEHFQENLVFVIEQHRSRKGAVILVTHGLDALLRTKKINYFEMTIA